MKILLESAQNFQIKLRLTAILLTGAALRLWGIFRPNLHLWDERFHALVAKNIALHWWAPTFYFHPLLEYDPSNWQGNHVWLHKPPLALWLGGLCLKIFGVTEWAYRIPSFLFGTISIFLTYQIAKRLFDEKTALLAAFFHALSGHLLIFNSGTYGMDNIDNALFFFTELSVWLWIKRLQDGKRIGILFSGLAIGLGLLSKSYPALLAWGLFVSLMIFKKYRTREHWMESFLMLIVALAVAMPWRIYSHHRWPAEFSAAEKLQWGHFNESQLSGQKTEWLYHFKNLPRDYGEFVIVALPLFFWMLCKNRSENFWIAALWFFVPYVLFSFAETKITTLVNYCAPPIFIAMSAATIFLLQKSKEVSSAFNARFLYGLVCVGFILFLRVTGEKLIQIGTGLFAVPKKSVIEMVRPIQDSQAVLFNCPQYTEAMFYSDITTYPSLPGAEQFDHLVSQGYTVFVDRISDEKLKLWESGIGANRLKMIRWIEPMASVQRPNFWEKVRSFSIHSS